MAYPPVQRDILSMTYIPSNDFRPMAPPLSRPAKRPVVILIEDDNRIALALEMLIEDWGYECVAVRTPAAAADHLGDRLGEAVAIVADFSRDDAFVGRRSAEAITHALGADLPRIVTTNDPTEAEAHGFSDVLAKPYDPEQLKVWLADHTAPRKGRGRKAPTKSAHTPR